MLGGGDRKGISVWVNSRLGCRETVSLKDWCRKDIVWLYIWWRCPMTVWLGTWHFKNIMVWQDIQYTWQETIILDSIVCTSRWRWGWWYVCGGTHDKHGWKREFETQCQIQSKLLTWWRLRAVWGSSPAPPCFSDFRLVCWSNPVLFWAVEFLSHRRSKV